jgi:hypothetical protein
METEDGLGVGAFFFKALIVDGFLHFFYFHVCNFLGSFTHIGKGWGSGVWGFFIKKSFFDVNFCDRL